MLKELFLAPLLVLSLSAQANPVNDRLNKVFDDVQAVMGTHARLVIDGNSDFDAMSDDKTVVFTLGALHSFKRDPDIFAALVGHELSHIKNKDFLHSKTSPQTEMRCDKEGKIAADRAGYNGSKVCGFMDLMKNANGDNGGPDYPTWSQRKANIGCGK